MRQAATARPPAVAPELDVDVDNVLVTPRHSTCAYVPEFTGNAAQLSGEGVNELAVVLVAVFSQLPVPCHVERVALPPPESPFLELDPELGIPGGFTPALVGEIALLLGVKPNIKILEQTPSLPNYPAGWEEKYDLLALPEGAGGYPGGRVVKYFFSGQESGWKIFCAAGDAEGMMQAVEHIFSYLNETGIYNRLYRNYVAEQK